MAGAKTGSKDFDVYKTTSAAVPLSSEGTMNQRKPLKLRIAKFVYTSTDRVLTQGWVEEFDHKGNFK